MIRRSLPATSLALLVAACSQSGPISSVEVGAVAGPAEALRASLRAQGRNAEVDTLVQRSEFAAGPVTHVRMEQVVDGLRVYGAYAMAGVDARGEAVYVHERLARPGRLATPAVTARDALAAALAELGDPPSALGAVTGIDGAKTSFARGTLFHRDPTVERVAYVDEQGATRAGYLVETWTVVHNQLDHTLVDAQGVVVSVEPRTANDSYNVFTEDPWKAPQAVVAGPGAGSAQSPSGWLGAGSQTTWNISGNNAHAYLDVDANNSPDTGGSAVTDGNFLTAADLSVAPSTTGNRAVAVQNLFFLNNYVHDQLYAHGFTESAGNFQANNFGLGGLGNDPVNAEAQDGSGTDNANFSTPNDGSSPRMQMYLWSGAGPNAFVTVGANQYGAYSSSFGRALTTTPTADAPLALANDGAGVTTDGCEKSTVSLTGKIAIVDRGTCNFTVKVANAQAAGAVAVIIVNNVAGDDAFSAGGTDRKIKISSVMVGNTTGTTLKGLVGSLANLRKNPVPPLMIDGDVDADIVYHEYGHGLTWRMVGSMSGAIPGALGEGASDVLAFILNGDDRIGEYAYSNALGIRRYPYDAYGLTYSAVTGGEVHNDGEIYAAAMWQVWKGYQTAGYTRDDFLTDFVGGLNYTPPGPSFEQMRDGMVQMASTASPSRACLVWSGFAALGIGQGSSMTMNRRGAVTSVTESYAVPSSCP